MAVCVRAVNPLRAVRVQKDLTEPEAQMQDELEALCKQEVGTNTELGLTA